MAYANSASPTKIKPRHNVVLDRLYRLSDSQNIAAELADDELGRIGARVREEFDIDERSNEEWMKQAKKSLDIALQVRQAKNYPFPHACYSLDTDILTAGGWRPIADVKIGEHVYTRREDGTATLTDVVRTFHHAATHMVEFKGRSIDLLVTPNHNMLVESRDRRPYFIQASEFLEKPLQWRYIPLTSKWDGKRPSQIYGIDPSAYMRLLGWFIAEGWSNYGKNKYQTVAGEHRDYGRSGGSFAISQSKVANPENYELLRHDIEACGFTYKGYVWGFVVHAKSMPAMVKAEWRSLGGVASKHIPRHALSYAPSLLRELLSTLVAGDGHLRADGETSYYTVSRLLADQMQELCQKLGVRASIKARTASVGGVVNGRSIVGARTGYEVAVLRRSRIKVVGIKRRLVPYGKNVACVELREHHTVFVRRNGITLWCGNSNIKWPLVTVAALQFNARAYPAIVDSKQVVKTRVIGSDEGVPKLDEMGQPVVDPESGEPQWEVEPGAKAAQAERISDHMSYQLLEEMDGWEEDTDTLLIQLPIVGTAFRKVYRGDDKNCAELVSGLDLVVNKKTKSLRTVPRATQKLTFYPYQIAERMADSRWLDIPLSPSVSEDNDRDAPREFLEQCTRLDLDGDKYPEPYIVTVDKDSGKVVRIVANFDGEDITSNDKRVLKIVPKQYFVKYGFIPDPRGGFYDIGFGFLLENISAAIDTTFNQMLDAGHLQNAGGGFIGTGLRMKKSVFVAEPGVYRTVNASGDDIRKAIVNLEHPGPSAVLFNLLGMMITASQDITSVKDILTTGGAEADHQQTAALGLAQIEQGMKVFTAIYKRIYRSLKEEYKLLFRLNAEYLDQEAYFNIEDTQKAIAKSDYDEKSYDVCPVADPDSATDMQRLGKAQFLLQTFLNDPLIDQIQLRKRALGAAKIDDPDSLIVKQQADPVAEAATKLELEGKDATNKKTMAETDKIDAETHKIAGEATKGEVETTHALVDLHDHVERGAPDVRGKEMDAAHRIEGQLLQGMQQERQSGIQHEQQRQLMKEQPKPAAS